MPVADPELQKRGVRGGHPDPEIRGGGRWSEKIFFRPFGPQFGLKVRARALPLDPPLNAPIRRFILRKSLL